jgi:hypothetical protein
MQFKSYRSQTFKSFHKLLCTTFCTRKSFRKLHEHSERVLHAFCCAELKAVRSWFDLRLSQAQFITRLQFQLNSEVFLGLSKTSIKHKVDFILFLCLFKAHQMKLQFLTNNFMFENQRNKRFPIA